MEAFEKSAMDAQKDWNTFVEKDLYPVAEQWWTELAKDVHVLHEAYNHYLDETANNAYAFLDQADARQWTKKLSDIDRQLEDALGKLQ